MSATILSAIVICLCGISISNSDDINQNASDAMINSLEGKQKTANTEPMLPNTITEIEELKTIIKGLTTKVDYLMQERTNIDKRITQGAVAFTAVQDHHEYVHPKNIIRFNRVLYNSGNAYNMYTGVFTAPRDGTYLLAFHIEDYHGQENPREQLVCNMMVDGVNQVDAVISPQSNSEQAGNTAVLWLRMGQTVWIEVLDEGRLYGSPSYRGTVFTGALIA